MRKTVILCSVVMLLVASSAVFAQQTEPPFKVEQVNDRMLVTSIVWAPDGRMFWTEKNGVVGVMSPDGVIQEDPVIEVKVKNDNEQGLLSIALAPDFETTHHFYVFYTAPATSNNLIASNVIFRYTERDGKGTNPVEMFRLEIPENDLNRHNGGRMKFGPKDNFLYVSIGDMGWPALGQDFDVLAGKIHRFSIIGIQLVPAPGNPVPGKSMWVHGLRNTFAFIFDPLTGFIFATENGPTCDDEINLIIPGMNYGWGPNVDCEDPLPQRQSAGYPPLISWTPTVAPTGIMLYDGAAFPDWQGQLFYCTFKVGGPYHVGLNEAHTRLSGEPVKLSLPDNEQCLIELAQGPDGYIYYSNIMGVYRLVPAPA